MTNLFQMIIQMSITGSIVILCVCLARSLLHKAPKIFSYALWSLVLFRLLCPVTFTSPVSLIPDVIAQGIFTNIDEAFHSDALSDDTLRPDNVLQNNTALPNDNNISNNIISENNDAQTILNQSPAFWEQPDNQFDAAILSDNHISALSVKLTDFMKLLPALWLLGFLSMTGYSIFSLLWIYRKVRVCVPVKDNIYLAEDINTPFTLGFFSPKIYLPTALSDKETDYIIAHEKHHIRRFDPVIRFVAFLTLCLHWFNPLVWLAFILAGKDMEMSCDEAVMRAFPEDIRKEYASSLLRLASGRRRISVVPLAFGENNIKARIVNVMHYKKPVFWMMTAAFVYCGVLTFMLMTNPDANDKSGEDNISTETTMEQEIVSSENEASQPATEFTQPEYQNRSVNKLYADLTGDGIDEMLHLTVLVPMGDFSFKPELLKDYIGVTCAKVSVYKGLGKDSYEETPIWTFEDISTAHTGNKQLSVVTKDEKNYLLSSSLWQGQGVGSYYYKVFSLTETGEEILADSYATGDFDLGSPMGQDLPLGCMILSEEFYDHLKEWMDNGTLIIAADIGLCDAEIQELMYSITDVNNASYKAVQPIDYYSRALGTKFTTKYFRCEFPAEWAGQISYRETHDGMVVEIYHKKSVDLGIATENGMATDLIGKLFLVPVGQTAADMTEYFLTQDEIAHARYIGGNIDGTYMPMACPSDKVIHPREFPLTTLESWHDQAAAEAYEEFFEMGAHFMDTRITNYVTSINGVLFSERTSSDTQYLMQYPDFGFDTHKLAYPNQPLVLENAGGKTVLFEAADYPEDHTALYIDGIDYSDIFEV